MYVLYVNSNIECNLNNIKVLSIFKTSAIINDDVKEKIKMLFPLAPIHNPNNLMGIKFLQERFPELTQVAVFDTSFHVSSMPAKAYRYYRRLNFRVFHGKMNKVSNLALLRI